ncbi:MAG: calcium-binding protein [Pseudomonadota bacterium]
MPTITLGSGNDTYIDDTIAPDQTVDTIFAGDGDDSIFSSTGDDIIYGGDGDDTISSNSAGFFTGDVVYGGDGDDVITTALFSGGSASTAADTVFGGDGNDSIVGAAGGPIPGTDVIFAGADDDTVDGNGGGDVIDLGAGNDLVIARIGEDTIEGGTGVDTIDFSRDYQSVTIDLQGGPTDLVNFEGDAEREDITGFEIVIGTNGNDTILGNAADNTLVGLAGDDVLDGRDGSDLFRPDGGANTITGGEGGTDRDVIDYSDRPLGLTVIFDGSERGVVIGGGSQQDFFSQIEVLDLTEQADFVDARNDDDGVEIFLRGGNDVVQPGVGADLLFGGDGIDRLNFVGTRDAVEIDNAAGTGSGGNAEGDTYDSFEDFVLTNEDDIFRGSDNAETVAGAQGSDFILGEGGNDTIVGDSGNDTIDPGLGDDSIDGGAGIDTVSYASAAAPAFVIGDSEFGLSINLSNRGDQFTGYGQDTILNFEIVEGTDFADILIGSNDQDTLFGGDGSDFLNGSGGSDALYGGQGFDALEGGLGADELFGGTGDGPVEGDIVVYFSANEELTFVFGATLSEIEEGSSTAVSEDTIGDDIEGVAGASNFSNTFDGTDLTGLSLLLGGSQSDTFDGGSGVDQILGLAGNDVIRGNGSGDALIGEGGDDDLFGGEGGDVFFFDGVNEGNDTIHDLELGLDLIFFTGGNLTREDVTFADTDANGDELTDSVLSYETGGVAASITFINIDAATVEAQATVIFA